MNFRMVLPIQLGVLALLGGAYFVYLTVSGPAKTEPDAAAPTVVKTIETTRIVSGRGGFAIGVPVGVTATKVKKTVSLSSKDKAFVVTAGPVEGGSLLTSSKAFVSSLKATYTEVRVLGTEEQEVDGRKALATYGQALNSKKVRVRFVDVVVAAKPRNFAINSFTGLDTNPSIVLPKVNAIVSTFTVLK